MVDKIRAIAKFFGKPESVPMPVVIETALETMSITPDPGGALLQVNQILDAIAGGELLAGLS